MNKKIDLLRRKLDRLREGGVPRCWDLFGGCGGLSLGFHTAAFEISAAVELDPEAARTHAHNFHRSENPGVVEVHSKARDICQLEPADLLAELGITSDPAEVVDVLLGGPPCQAYARVGRAKLREVGEHATAFLNDPRGQLFERYLHYVDVLKPPVVVMENVPDVMNYSHINYDCSQRCCARTV